MPEFSMTSPFPLATNTMNLDSVFRVICAYTKSRLPQKNELSGHKIVLGLPVTHVPVTPVILMYPSPLQPF